MLSDVALNIDVKSHGDDVVSNAPSKEARLMSKP